MDNPDKEYYDEHYYGRGDSKTYIKLPFRTYDYYGEPLRILDCRAGEKLLDVACGEGHFLVHAESIGVQCWGIDISVVATDRARGQCKASIACADINMGLPYEDKFFDYVTCLGSLEHFEKQSFVLGEIRRVTKDSGRIYILVPNDDYILHKFGYETDYQPIVNRFSLSGYSDMLIKSGLAIDRILSDNSHLSNLAASASLPKLVLKLIGRPFVPFVPLRYSFNLIFLCRPWARAT